MSLAKDSLYLAWRYLRHHQMKTLILVAAIATAREQATFSRLLAALGVAHVGGVVARPVAARYQRLSALLAVADATSSEELIATIRRSIVEYSGSDTFRDDLTILVVKL